MALLKGNSAGVMYGPSYGESPWPEFEAVQSDLSAAQSHFKAKQFALALDAISHANMAMTWLRDAISEIKETSPNGN